ncbi:MAG TPA: ATP-binding cassette domain-containing protein [Burkholderiales bacterium]|nr:ATP-binding cassette domain-containing protein [Burkholderiales bacterium]
MTKIVELKNVMVYRGDTKVFDGLSIELIAGRNTVILGPNGAGKTTLLKLLSREIYPVDRDDSFMRIFGQEHWNVWELRARLGIVSQDLQREYRAEPSGLHVILSGYHSSIGVWGHQEYEREQLERAREIMAMLGIAALEDKHFADMSTGEERRFLLGRALINDPDTLVLDEPTSGLDLKATFQYLDVVRALMQAGKTVVLVTHHIHEIPPEITHAILIKDGRVVAQGDKVAVLTSERLSSLFDIPVKLVQANGFYQVLPH